MIPERYAEIMWKKVPSAVIIVLALSLLLISCFSMQKETVAMNKKELMIVPEEFIIYRDYIRIIGGIPHVSDIATVEATVLSITKTEVYPCGTDPFAPEPKLGSIAYPKHLGIVGIDRINNYTPYRDRILEHPIEQPTGNKVQEKEAEKTVSGSKGPIGKYSSKKKKYRPLQEGEEVQTRFLLTVSPAKIRYVPIITEDTRESGRLSENFVPQKTVTHKVEGRRAFKPLPKEGKYFVLTTKVGNFPKIIEKTLPGLKEGDKFRAEIYYDGSLYVQEYEMVTEK